MTELYCIDHSLGANDIAHVADCGAGRSSEIENLSCIFGKYKWQRKEAIVIEILTE